MNEETQLKPCPFCGGRAEMAGHCNGMSFTAGCANPDCPVGPVTPYLGDEQEAIAAWNRRAQ